MMDERKFQTPIDMQHLWGATSLDMEDQGLPIIAINGTSKINSLPALWSSYDKQRDSHTLTYSFMMGVIVRWTTCAMCKECQ